MQPDGRNLATTRDPGTPRASPRGGRSPSKAGAASPLPRIGRDFAQGNTELAVARFHAFLARCRHEANPQPENGPRAAEARAYAAAFASAFGAAAPNRVLHLVADSMALPRPAAGIAAQDTYPWLLQAAWQRRAGAGALLIPSCRRGLTIPDALQVMPALPPADGLLLHLGIVDCAPRSLSRHDAASVAALHGQACADALVALARMHRRALEADRRRSVYVPLTRFGRALRRLLREAKARFGFVALVGIVRPSDGDAPAANTPLTDNIEEYNALSRRLARAEGARFLDLDHAIWSRPGAAGCFADDGYHFNRLGHLRCAELLMATLFEPAEPMARPSSASVRGLPPERR